MRVIRALLSSADLISTELPAEREISILLSPESDNVKYILLDVNDAADAVLGDCGAAFVVRSCDNYEADK